MTRKLFAFTINYRRFGTGGSDIYSIAYIENPPSEILHFIKKKVKTLLCPRGGRKKRKSAFRIC